MNSGAPFQITPQYESRQVRPAATRPPRELAFCRRLAWDIGPRVRQNQCAQRSNGAATRSSSLRSESAADSSIPARRNDVTASKPSAPLHGGNFDGIWSRRKKNMENKYLQAHRYHICVLFVQHPSENALCRAGSERSFVVCARSFGNSDYATEGGIPRSSRFRWFA